jgi:hypothetical protein
MSESDNSSTTSKLKKKITLTVQATIIGALLMSLVWLVPSVASTSAGIGIIPAAFATPAAACGDFPATITGTNDNDTLVGTPQRDVIAALGGNDTVQALGGDDKVCGGDGNDQLNGTEGNDDIDGGVGDDILRGGDGNDQLNGGTGTDDGDDGPGFNTCLNLEIEANCQA